MELWNFLAFGKQIAVVKEAWLIVAALIAVEFLVVWRWRSSFDQGEINALKAHIAILQERLRLAEDKERPIAPIIEQLGERVAQLRFLIASEGLPETVASTTRAIQSAVSDLTDANIALSSALRSRGEDLLPVFTQNEQITRRSE